MDHSGSFWIQYDPTRIVPHQTLPQKGTSIHMYNIYIECAYILRLYVCETVKHD